VAGAGRLGHGQPHLEVLAAPDQGGGHGDAVQVGRWDRRHGQLRHEPAQGGGHGRGAGPVEGVGGQGGPAPAELPGQAVQVDEALAEQPVAGVGGRFLGEPAQGLPERRVGVEGGQAEAVHQHQPVQPVAVLDGEAGGHGPAQTSADQHRRPRAGPLEQLAQPGQHAVGVQGAGRGGRGAVAGQVGGDHPVGGGQAGEDPQPHGGELARAVQQDQGRAVAALQHGGGDAGQLQAPLGDGEAGQQPPAGVGGRAGPVVAGDLVCGGCHRPAPRIGVAWPGRR